MRTPTFDPQRSAEIRAQLQHMSNAEALIIQDAPKRKTRWMRPTFALAGAAALIVGVAGGIQMNAASAQAESTLKELAQVSITYQDSKPGPGQYLKIAKGGPAKACSINEQGENYCYDNGYSTRNFFVPAESDKEWVFEMRESVHPEYDEVFYARDGAFMGNPLMDAGLLEHATSGAELYEYVKETNDGGSLSRNEANFIRLTDDLKTGTIPAEDRAVFYEALSLVPGVDVTLGVKTLDGREGVSIGRTEPLRTGLREEIIVDQRTGQVIGAREISTVEILGYGKKGETTYQTDYVYSIVDEVPAEHRLPVPEPGPNDGITMAPDDE